MRSLFDELLIYLGGLQVFLVLFAFLLLLIFRDYKGSTFAGVSAIFYLLGNFYFPYLVEWDVGNLYRYYIWFFHELCWMGTIAVLGFKALVHWKQSWLGQLLCLPILVMNFFRALDMSFAQYNFSLSSFQIVYPIFETAIVALCWLPLAGVIKNKLVKYQKSPH